MKKRIYFDILDDDRWPSPEELRRILDGRNWSYDGGNDSWGLSVYGLYGTDGLPPDNAVNVDLSMIGNPRLGVTLQFRLWDGRIQSAQTYYCKGDTHRLQEFVRSLHGTLLSVGLFIPFPLAWKAIIEFIETDGELPKSIEWIEGHDLPASVFPDP